MNVITFDFGKLSLVFDSLSGFNEWEVLQPRGVRYKVVSTKTKKLKNGQTLTEIEVAPLPNQTAAVPKGGAVTPKASTSKAKTPTATLYSPVVFEPKASVPIPTL